MKYTTLTFMIAGFLVAGLGGAPVSAGSVPLFKPSPIPKIPPQKCSSMTWQYARGQKTRDNMEIFSRINRKSLIQSFYGELTTMKDKALARDMAKYLIETEQDPARKAVFSQLVWATDVTDTDGGAAAMPLKQICQIEETVLKKFASN